LEEVEHLFNAEKREYIFQKLYNNTKGLSEGNNAAEYAYDP
jgi:hypothetical protein